MKNLLKFLLLCTLFLSITTYGNANDEKVHNLYKGIDYTRDAMVASISLNKTVKGKKYHELIEELIPKISIQKKVKLYDRIEEIFYGNVKISRFSKNVLILLQSKIAQSMLSDESIKKNILSKSISGLDGDELMNIKGSHHLGEGNFSTDALYKVGKYKLVEFLNINYENFEGTKYIYEGPGGKRYSISYEVYGANNPYKDNLTLCNNGDISKKEEIINGEYVVTDSSCKKHLILRENDGYIVFPVGEEQDKFIKAYTKVTTTHSTTNTDQFKIQTRIGDGIIYLSGVVKHPDVTLIKILPGEKVINVSFGDNWEIPHSAENKRPYIKYYDSEGYFIYGKAFDVYDSLKKINTN